MAVAGRRGGGSAPSPDLSPADVLAAVLRALAANQRSGPARGADVVYDFASDRMRSAIGGVDAFARALRNDLYAPLAEAERTETIALERRGDSARGVVAVVSRGRVTARFTVALARAAHGDRRGCWLLSGIAREGIDL